MSLALLLVAFAAGAASSDVSSERANFATMSDLQIDAWLLSNRFYHAANVYQCRGFSRQAAELRLGRALGPDFDARSTAIGNALRARYADAYDETSEYILIGYRQTPAYCRRIRFVVRDMLRATAVLEHRLGLVR